MEERDFRIYRSKRDLRNALLSLLKEEAFEKISVKDICDYAHINKMTFYRHYDDKYDLLNDATNSIAEEIYKKCASSLVKNQASSLCETCALISGEVIEECFNRKEEILSVIDSNNSLGSEVLNGTIENIVNRLLDELSRVYNIKYKRDYVSTFIVGGYSALVAKLLRGKRLPKEQIVKGFMNIYKDAIASNLIINR